MRTLLVILTLVACLAGPLSAEPAIELSTTEFDFGHVVARTTLYYTVWLRSTGDEPLKVFEIKTGCDCAIMPLAKREIAPGDSVAATLQWQTERAHGPIRRFPRIFTNASLDPERLIFSAMVLNHADSSRPISILPYRFVFTEFAGKKRDSITFTLTNHGTENYQVLLPLGASPDYEIVLPDSLAAGETETGFVRLKEALIGETFDATLTVQFNAKGREPRRFSVPVRHEIYAP